MNLLMEEIKKYAGIINESIPTERIYNGFKGYYSGKGRAALNIAVDGLVCYKNNNCKAEYDDKGGVKLQIDDLKEVLGKYGLKDNLVDLKRYIRGKLEQDGILNDKNKSGFDSVFNEFLEILKSNMNSARNGAKQQKKQVG